MALSSQWLLVGRGLCVHRRGVSVAVADLGRDLGTLEKTGFWRGAIWALEQAMCSRAHSTSHSLSFPLSLSWKWRRNEVHRVILPILPLGPSPRASWKSISLPSRIKLSVGTCLEMLGGRGRHACSPGSLTLRPACASLPPHPPTHAPWSSTSYLLPLLDSDKLEGSSSFGGGPGVSPGPAFDLDPLSLPLCK